MDQKEKRERGDITKLIVKVRKSKNNQMIIRFKKYLLNGAANLKIDLYKNKNRIKW
jgi:hypothetical protein